MGQVAEQKPADAVSESDREVQELRQQLLESQKMIEQVPPCPSSSFVITLEPRLE